MRLRGIKITLSGPEGSSPPLPYVTVDDEEGAALIAAHPGWVSEFVEGGEPVGAGLAEPEPEADAAALVEPEAVTAAPTDSAEAPSVEGAGTPSTETVEQPEAAHASDLTDAFELLGADDFVKTGPRAGKPKVDAVKDIVERDVTADEIDAAWEARSAA